MASEEASFPAIDNRNKEPYPTLQDSLYNPADNLAELIIEQLEKARKDGKKYLVVMEIDQFAYKVWWFAFFYHIFGWIPLSMMSVECRSIWNMLKDMKSLGYTPSVDYMLLPDILEMSGRYIPVLGVHIK